MIKHITVQGDDVRLIALPRYTRKAVVAWERFIASDSIFGMDVESTAIEGLGTYDPNIEMRLIQFGNRCEGWALDPADPRWRKRITSFLADEAKRFVSHNAAFDSVRVWFEFNLWLGDRSLDTLPMAAQLWPGITARKGLKDLSDKHIDSQLSEAQIELHARFTDLYTAQKPRKTRLLPATFEPGVSLCRQTKAKNKPKCEEPSWEGSLCGLCREHYLDRGRKKNAAAEEWGWRNIEITDPVYLQYAGMDAVYVRRLLDLLAEKMTKARMNRLSKQEQRVKRYCVSSSLRGMKVDRGWLMPILEEVQTEFDSAQERVEEVTGLRARSSYMKDWLAQRGVVAKSLDKDHLPELIAVHGAKPEVGPVLHDLKLVSDNSNLLSNLATIKLHAEEGDGFVHPNINTQQAHTGRMSYTGPAMQTLAKNGEKGTRLRGCFVARPGYALVGADYDNQEICIAAALSRDPAYLKIAMEHLSQHVLTAESIFPDFKGKEDDPLRYHQAKTLDFAQQYGAMPRKIAATLSISEREALILWQKWRHTYAGLVRWSDMVARQDHVRNPFGRVIPRDPYRDFANANYLIQSTGRDVLGTAICRLADAGWGDSFWMFVHDEMILEVPEERAQEAADALTKYMTMEVKGVPITATGEVIGDRWRGLH